MGGWKRDIVVVEWEDSCSDDDWHSKSAILRPLPIISIGFLTHLPSKAEPYMTIRRSEDRPEGDGNQDGEFCIPASAIKNYRTIRVCSPPKPKLKRRKRK